LFGEFVELSPEVLMKRSQLFAVIGGVVLLIALTAGAAAYVTQATINDDKSVSLPRAERVVVHQQAALVPPAANCDDGNIVGHVLGGAAGGVAGSQIGSGSGQTAATIAGTLGGAYVGGEYIPTRNVTCR
jgi:uncharacterized protein YcfJ